MKTKTKNTQSLALHAADQHDRIRVQGARENNLKDVSVEIPKRRLTVFTSVAGSGKSSLVHGSIPAGACVVSIDQGAIRGSRRSNPATYTGLLDPIRKAFAKANGVKPALFRADSEGACPNCNGAGIIYTDLAMMAGVYPEAADRPGCALKMGPHATRGGLYVILVYFIEVSVRGLVRLLRNGMV